MKPLSQNEIFQNLSGFLKTRGIELKDGSYAQGIQKSCSLLTDAINLGQESVQRAKAGLDKTVDHLRKVVHEKTAPKPPRCEPPVIGPAAQAKAESPATPKPKKREPASPRKRAQRKSGK